jgi:SAM-dependent MidA family methyltransferase
LNTKLADLIRQYIRKRGPVSFSWFMQQALYHPEHGYYSSGRAAIGRKGDYFTNISVGPIFGRLWCAQFAEIWQRMSQSEDHRGTNSFVVVEQGAHDGRFARDVLEAAQTRWPEFFADLRYRIVEPFPFWQKRQQEMLDSFRDKVEWREAIEPFTGIHFSNELLDALPIDLPGKAVDLKGDDLVLIDQVEAAYPGLAGAEKTGPPSRVFNQAALDWIDNVARNLDRGYVLLVDYGDVCDHFQPNIQVRARHRKFASPFEQVGYADITAHVNWKHVAARARQNGLRLAGFTDQHHFLTGIISEWPDLVPAHALNLTDLTGQVSRSAADPKGQRALQTLLHPEMLGRSFQVLALKKNVDRATPSPSVVGPALAKSVGVGAVLAGFKFAQASNL